MLTLKKAVKSEHRNRLFRCNATQINRFWLDKCVESCLICIMSYLTVGQPHLENFFYLIMIASVIFKIEADFAETNLDKMLCAFPPLLFIIFSYTNF